MVLMARIGEGSSASTKNPIDTIANGAIFNLLFVGIGLDLTSSSIIEGFASMDLISADAQS